VQRKEYSGAQPEIVGSSLQDEDLYSRQQKLAPSPALAALSQMNKLLCAGVSQLVHE
jgi:hypothetical protein